MPNFKDLKKNRLGRTALLEQLDKADTNKRTQDKRIYYPARDEKGNAKVVIRFLPAKDTELPRVKTFNHGFKGPGGWLVTKCPTTINEKCPVCESNGALVDGDGGDWDSVTKATQTTVRQRKRKVSYYSNIRVITDPRNPENEGKTFLLKYGVKIWEKIKYAMAPDFEDETPIDVFDFWEGSNFTWVIKKVDKETDYSNSSFDKEPSSLSDDDAVLEEIFNSMHDLGEWIKPESFDSYETIQERLDKVLGTSASAPKQSSAPSDDQSMKAADISKTAEAPKLKTADITPTEIVEAGDDSDTLSFFEGLAGGGVDDDDILF